MYERMRFTGVRVAGSVFMTRWVCAGLLLVSILAPHGRSEADDYPGLGDPACFAFYLYKPSVTSARIVSPARTEYYLTATGQAGREGCAGWMGPSPMSVAASWDAASRTASEQIEYGGMRGSTYWIVIHIQASCDKDPWMYYAGCSLISAANNPTDGPLSGHHFDGPYPVSGAALTKAQKEAVVALVGTLAAPSGGFKLPPMTPPVIASPARDGIYRNGSPVSVAIRRPTDGDAGWYAAHPLEFDLEFEVWRPDAGMMWASVSPAVLLGRATLTTAPMTVALTNFSTRGPGKSGEWQTWRVRARVRDAATSRPWSDWQPFNVVVPITYTPRPGGVPVPGADAAGAGKSGAAAGQTFDVYLPSGAKARGQIVGNKLMLGGGTGRPTPAPDGRYKTGDGRSVVIQGGIIVQGSGIRSIRESPLR